MYLDFWSTFNMLEMGVPLVRTNLHCMIKGDFIFRFLEHSCAQEFEYLMCVRNANNIDKNKSLARLFRASPSIEKQVNGKSFQVWQQSQIPSLLGLSWHICSQKWNSKKFADFIFTVNLQAEQYWQKMWAFYKIHNKNIIFDI